jgi:NDP-sugar pyrophosphorylase family protein
MIWLIPIGGKGLRTQQLGEFKPFIEVSGHKIITWLLFSIKRNVKTEDKFVFTTTDYFLQKFQVKKELEKVFDINGLDNEFKVISTDKELLGNSASVYLAKQYLATDEPVSVLCCDQFTDFQLPSEIPPQTGYLTIGIDFGSSKGYVEIEDGLIKKFVEKEPISNFAGGGIYIVSSGKALISALESQFRDKAISVNGEYCLGPVFNYLVKDGFQIYPLLAKAHYSLGSIPAINCFNSSPIIKSLSKALFAGGRHVA